MSGGLKWKKNDLNTLPVLTLTWYLLCYITHAYPEHALYLEAASILITASLGEVRRFGEAERRGRWVWEGVSPSLLGERPGEGAVPPPRKFSIFGLQIATYGALWGYFYGSVDCFGRR